MFSRACSELQSGFLCLPRHYHNTGRPSLAAKTPLKCFAAPSSTTLSRGAWILHLTPASFPVLDELARHRHNQRFVSPEAICQVHSSNPALTVSFVSSSCCSQVNRRDSEEQGAGALKPSAGHCSYWSEKHQPFLSPSFQSLPCSNSTSFVPAPEGIPVCFLSSH